LLGLIFLGKLCVQIVFENQEVEYAPVTLNHFSSKFFSYKLRLC